MSDWRTKRAPEVASEVLASDMSDGLRYLLLYHIIPTFISLNNYNHLFYHSFCGSGVSYWLSLAWTSLRSYGEDASPG